MTLGPRETFFRNYPQQLWAPPGAVFDYLNAGFVLASQVLTAAAGVPEAQFEQLVHGRVFVPAGMTTATYDAATAPCHHRRRLGQFPPRSPGTTGTWV